MDRTQGAQFVSFRRRHWQWDYVYGEFIRNIKKWLSNEKKPRNFLVDPKEMQKIVKCNFIIDNSWEKCFRHFASFTVHWFFTVSVSRWTDWSTRANKTYNSVLSERHESAVLRSIRSGHETFGETLFEQAKTLRKNLRRNAGTGKQFRWWWYSLKAT